MAHDFGRLCHFRRFDGRDSRNKRKEEGTKCRCDTQSVQSLGPSSVDDGRLSNPFLQIVDLRFSYLINGVGRMHKIHWILMQGRVTYENHARRN